MKLISFNPAHKHLYSEDFITGFNEGAKRQYEADARPKGKWIEYPIADGMNQCSACGVLRFGESNYCPNCGADMREEDLDG